MNHYLSYTLGSSAADFTSCATELRAAAAKVEAQAVRLGALPAETVTLSREELSDLLVSAAAVGWSAGPEILTRGDLQNYLRTYPKLRDHVLEA